MTINYFDNKSLLGKKSLVQGITNLNSHPYKSFVQYITHTVTGGGSFNTNNTLDTSNASIFGQGSDSINYNIAINYNASSSNTLNWTLSVSSEGCCDAGSLTLNNVVLADIRGEVTQSGSLQMRDGPNTLVLRYLKDGSESVGTDTTTASWTFT